MVERNLDEDYRRILEASRERGEVLDEAPGAERRAHPRVRVRPEALPPDVDPWVAAIDISIAGMAFYAEDPVTPGDTITIAPGGALAADVEVVGCEEVPADDAANGTAQGSRYRLHCRFADEADGMRLLVAIKELEAAGGG